MHSSSITATEIKKYSHVEESDSALTGFEPGVIGRSQYLCRNGGKKHLAQTTRSQVNRSVFRWHLVTLIPSNPSRRCHFRGRNLTLCPPASSTTDLVDGFDQGVLYHSHRPGSGPSYASAGGQQQNLHKKLQRQLTLNPSCDPRLYNLQRRGVVTRHLSYDSYGGAYQHQQQQQQQQQHANVTRISSAPHPHGHLQQCAPGAIPGLPTGICSASDSQLQAWGLPPPQQPPLAPNADEARRRLHYHLASIFPEEQVRTAMTLYPNETNPQKICAAILALYPAKQRRIVIGVHNGRRFCDGSTATGQISQTIEGGITAVVWSPDEEFGALVNSKNELFILTANCDVMNYWDLQDDTEGEHQFINVGWGKKETQFQGSAGKAAAYAKPEQVNADEVKDEKSARVSWRGDSSIFAVSYWDTRVNKRKIKIFSREGLLQCCGEDIAGLEEPLCWRPQGNITMVQRLPNKHVIAFMEKNGLKHYDFPLPDGLTCEEISCRKVENGSKLILTTGTSVVLQMPRGNLETIHPRALTFVAIGAMLENFDYRQAVQTLRKNRILLDVCVDHNPDLFLKNVDTFVDQVDPHSLVILISELSKADVTMTVYGQFYSKIAIQVHHGTKSLLNVCRENLSTIWPKYVKGPRAGPGPLGPRAPGILPPLPPPLDGPDPQGREASGA
ncbi:unnamed protein product [Nesidiocoris tenuis]|uniref:Uncharacterized protein n=1 Tax=Nesidiocoris tenuis TaxID=355587 RepID=A0A6H5HDE2_9HEMI|nr:unnamed protein product [Nesidiocoris tenuis]